MLNLKKEFINNFPDSTNCSIVISPLRICPLGAHVDHQHGLVTGMALDAAVHFVYSQGENGYVQVRSLDFPDEESFNINSVPGMVPGFWGNYLRGTVLALSRNHILKHGIKGLISGKLPIGGLSSSAAVTTAYLMALCDVNGIHFSKQELVQYSHWVENQFIKLNNGILDQAANILTKDNHLMFMDTHTEEYQLIPMPLEMPDFEVVVVYSGISKALIGTDYNNRVDECKVAAWVMQELAQDEIASLKETRLRDVDNETYRRVRAQLPTRFRKRADHFFTENERVKQGVKAWEIGDLETFGRLMFESGESSIHNYECGCPELITIFEILKNTPGVYGARFSGAGYRGCCIGLIDPKYKEPIKARLDQEYPKKHPEYKDVYQVNFCKTGDGARIVKEIVSE
jgi:galactokinase/galacturonokinase